MSYSFQTLRQILADAGVEEADDEAMLLLERFCARDGATRASLFADRTKEYTSSALDEAVAKRLTHYPVQYILGTWEFYGCPFRVNEHCLIPRPDTEILVEAAIRCLPPRAHAVDLCTGSGCIAVAVLKNRPDVTITALELYPDTLELATENARLNGVADRFHPVQADLLHNGVERLADQTPFDAILSNPPYIRTKDLRDLAPELDYEPRAALDGGESGLIFYRAILQDYAPLLKKQGKMLLEIGYDQEEDLRKLAGGIRPEAAVSFLKDLGNRTRVAILS